MVNLMGKEFGFGQKDKGKKETLLIIKGQGKVF
jgi:hypothetical protein